MLKCPGCGSNTRVVDSRDSGKYLRRRRECYSCKKRFTTYERVDDVQKLMEVLDYYRKNFPKDKRSDKVLMDILVGLIEEPVMDLLCLTVNLTKA